MRLFKRQERPANGKAQALSGPPDPGRLAWLPGAVEVQVAGEFYHQTAVKKAAELASQGSPLSAVLVPEPDNAYDPHAVAVYAAGQHVGYLPRDVAWRVQPALAAFSEAHGGRLVSCPAQIRSYGDTPQVVLLLNPEPLGLLDDRSEIVPEMAVVIGKLLTRLDEAAPRLTGIDQEARTALLAAAQDCAETEDNYDHDPADWPRLEREFRSLTSRFAKAHDPSLSAAWLGVGRSTRYQRGRRDDTLRAFIEALYWDRGSAEAWLALVDFASAAPHVPTLLALFARVPFEVRADVLDQLLSISHGHDRIGRLSSASGEKLRTRLLDVAESEGDTRTVATLAGKAGLACEKAGDLVHSVATGGAAGAILLQGNENLTVVGESFHQDNLWSLVGGCGDPARYVRVPIIATMSAEPDNPYDRNAVAVSIDGLKVGHLTRQDAQLYRPGLLALQRKYDRPIALAGMIVGGGYRQDGPGLLGVFLNHDPEDFGVQHLAPPRPARSGMRTGLSEELADSNSGWSDELAQLSGLPKADVAALPALRQLLSHETDPIKRHFIYSQLEARLYRCRDVFASALDEFDQTCRQHDAEMDGVRKAFLAEWGSVPLLELYRQMAIRMQKAHDYRQALWWAERGIALYGSEPATSEGIDDLRHRAADYMSKLRDPIRQTRHATSPDG